MSRMKELMSKDLMNPQKIENKYQHNAGLDAAVIFGLWSDGTLAF